MALSRTNLLGAISGTSGNFGTGAYTPAAFTPPDSSLLAVAVSLIENGGSGTPLTDLTIAGGGLTYTSRVSQSSPGSGFVTGTRIYTAPVTTGASMQITLDCGARSIGEYCLSAVAYTGYDTGSPVGATAAGTQDSGFTGPPDPYSITLSAAPAASSEVFACAGMDKSAAGATPGSGWTEIHDVTNVDWGGLETEVRAGSTSTTVSWADLRSGGGALFNVSAVALEIKEAAGGGGGGLALPPQPRIRRLLTHLTR